MQNNNNNNNLTGKSGALSSFVSICLEGKYKFKLHYFILLTAIVI